ncbi:hypothetical protein J41TS12_29710 [Paenibacillus antibioticophila]|uniref:Uncharacterized protein n=1 Tax=Paenibacillus antibioticophila TaxID=1274374 RepID=A0A920CFX0_9BACL|nr:hypothetical protein J41TS12_29710 [Paenibacillus antibioticophila]
MSKPLKVDTFCLQPRSIHTRDNGGINQSVLVMKLSRLDISRTNFGVKQK